AFDGGVRALEGATGSEQWRASLGGPVLSGAAVDSGATGSLLVVSGSPSVLNVLNAATGRAISKVELGGEVVGAPAPFVVGDTRGVVLGIADGTVDVRDGKGERVRSVKLDTKITTAPIVLTVASRQVVVVGTESGLVSLDATDLHPLGRVATEDDAPRGALAAADMDNDGSPEIVMITRRGLIVVVNTADGKIRWYMGGANDAASAAFADLNNDGVLDVLVPAGQTFAVGLSGRDHSLVWRVEEDVKAAAQTRGAGQLRSLAVLPQGGAPTPLLVGSDVSGTGLRAVGLPANSVKASVRE
ncbi:MAG TPA: PQQ-binding-like beta-propeller repeat protein, partial [Pyrinomonadaceae bacterium]